MTLSRSALRYSTYPVMMTLALVVSRWAWLRGAGQAGAVSAVVVGAGVLVFALERAVPKTPRWRPHPDEWWRDLASSVLWHSLLPGLVQGLLAGAVAAAGSALAHALGTQSLWPSSLWLPLQVYLALALAELFPYWVHRIFHTTEWGWAVHSVHHSTERMHFLAAGRNHPLNVAVVVAFKVLTLALAGVPDDVLALAAVFNGVGGLLQHANLDQRCPGLNWLVATPELHVWHHSKEPRHANANYGTNVIIWDVLFGTRRLPDGEVTDDVGLHYPFPQTLLGQLAVPFTWSRISALMHAAHAGKESEARPRGSVEATQ